ncbi:hypothetical protein BC939DRAFT_531711 [Gamsiella multidivaricata]|uniref:uncharacterized protein n=1 Tax=Gamsiella multidivaricata TaxID=101098 RepID=UPI002220D1DC|nr:uncharacterized protein BC939DRAFT_531711 [Gamsiella multidivaricata]KAG0363814.1 hypothetical protein BGZ54_008001 [Gamsiella multidivaricata]KAI7818888.1 hypothetical protein BC939DRAFT_531711 [Gamsiella multidivaricata]
MSSVGNEEEEEDYMSEAFLESLAQDSANDKTRRENITYSERRRQKHTEHLANLPKPLHVREKEAREKGLTKEIGEENKGMAMLLKMGFKKGGTLGASKPQTSIAEASAPSKTSPDSISKDGKALGRSDALRAPLEIQIKQGRGGLGMDSLRKRQAEEELQRHESEAHRVFDEGFRGQKRNQFELEKRTRQVGAARGICMVMDAKKAQADSEIAETNQLRNLGRSNSFWWIADSVPDEILGTKLMGPGAEVVVQEDGLALERGEEASIGAFDHSDDEDGGPEHKKEKRIKLDPLRTVEVYDNVVQDEEPPKWGERPDFAQLEMPEKLAKVVQHLRDEHLYCFWCSAQYSDPEDLAENCPGPTEDDH